jgi:hypothetical protein
MALNACVLSHHAEGRECGADGAVQIDSRFNDALPCFRLLLGPALEGICPCHQFHYTSMCNQY